MDNVLINLLNPEKFSREISEQQLENLKSQNPSQYCELLIKTIQFHSNESLKLLSVLLLRQHLPKAWQNLDPDSKYSVKSSLISTLQACNSWNIAKNISFAISELAIYIIQSDTGEKWPNFLGFLLKGIQSEDFYVKFASFSIISEIVPYFADTFSRLKEKLVPIFIKNLDHGTPEIKIAAIQAFTVFISVINTAETLKYSEMLKNLLEAVRFMCVSFGDKEENCVKYLIELAETEPLYFRTSLKLCFEFLETVTKEVTSLGVKVNLLEFMIILIEKHSSSFFDKNNILSGTCQLITEALSQCSLDPFSLEINQKKTLVSFLQRIITAIGESIIDYIIKLSESILSSPFQEQFFFSALILMSESVEFTYNTEKILFVFNTIHTFILSESSKLRTACFRIVKKLLKIKDFEFKNRICLNILPIIIRGLNDSEEGVVIKALKTCKKFAQNSAEDVVSKYAQDLLPLILGCAIKKNCRAGLFQTITAFAYVCKLRISLFFSEIFANVKEIIENSSVSDKCKALDCLVSLRKITTRPQFLKIIPEYIQILNYLQSLQNDLLRSACLKSLISLSTHLKSNFTPYLPFIVPNLLFQISTHSILESENSLETLLSIIDSTKGGYLQYVEKTSELIILLFKSSISDSIKILVCHIGSSLISVIRESGNPDFVSILVIYARGFLNEIWKLCENETEFEILIEMLRSLNGVINAPGYDFLTDCEVQLIGTGIWEFLIRFEEKNSEVSNKGVEILNAAFNRLNSFGVVEVVYKNTIKGLQSQISEEETVFGIYVLNGIITCLTGKIKMEWIEDILKLYIYYINTGTYTIKKHSFVAITILSTNITSDQFMKIAKNLLTALESSLNALNSSKSVKDRKVKDQALITIGKIIRARLDCLAGELIINWWASYLPITSQKAEAQEMHDFLADVILNFLPGLVNNEKIIKVFVHISFTEMCGNPTLPKIKKALEMFLENSSSEALYGCIPNKHRHKVQKLLNIN